MFLEFWAQTSIKGGGPKFSGFSYLGVGDLKVQFWESFRGDRAVLAILLVPINTVSTNKIQ